VIGQDMAGRNHSHTELLFISFTPCIVLINIICISTCK